MRPPATVERQLAGTSAVVWGAASRRVLLVVHGAQGDKRDPLVSEVAEVATAHGYQVVSVDLPGHGDRTDAERLVPWAYAPELRAVHAALCAGARRPVALAACSLGAYFALQALADRPVARALLMSPLVDMAAYIRRKLREQGLSEHQLRSAGTIALPQGQPLSREYFSYACSHPVRWRHPTRVLWGRHDDVVPRQDIDRFAGASHAEVTTLDAGHSFGPELAGPVRAWLADALS